MSLSVERGILTDESHIDTNTKLANAVRSAITQKNTSRGAVLGMVLGGTMMTPTSAEAQALEEVVVTGIRASLERAVDQKRNASGVVDAISAQDIGAFPDTNLAESLQRITGVSIDRSRGEGSKVTVRGFGPSFNLVTLNGRQMPTANGDDRSFDFADLASEGISGVQVYKSGNADVSSGGIGSTINIQTRKPLDSPGRLAVVSGKLAHDTSTERGDSITPEISGLYSNSFADQTFGVAVSGSYQKRDSGLNTGTTGDYNNYLGVVNTDWGGPGIQQWGGIPNNADQTNRPGDTDIYAVPQSIGYELAEFSRERVNGQLTLQWDPTDDIRTSLDYTYSEVDFERTFNNYSGWFNFGAQVTEYTDGPIASPILYQENGAATDFAMAAGRDGVITENNSVGFNVNWQATDRLNLELDYHNSEATSGASGANGTSSQLAIASFTREVTRGIFEGDLPILNLDLANPLDPNDLIVTGSVFDNKATKMEIDQTTFRGQFDLNDTTNIDFGVQLTNVDNRSQFANVQRDTWGGTTQPGDIADLLTPSSGAGAFDQISNGEDSRRQDEFFVFDIDALIARTEELGATQSTGGDCGTGLCPSTNFTTDRITEEETTALYVQFNHDRDLGNMPLNIKFGLRYEETDVNSQALVPAYSAVVISCLDANGDPVLAGCNEFSAIQAVDSNGAPIQDFTQLAGKYDHILPNLDIKLDITDNLVARVSYSETVTRPNFTDIQGGQTINSLIRVSGGNGNRGNPALLPFESENIDLSVEYYFGGTDYISAGYFTKDVSNFIGSSIIQDEVLFPALIHPATGMPVTFDVTAPINEKDATIDGFEVAIQKFFGDTGFGVIANATFVDANVAFNNLSLETQFALNGLSDSANLIGVYENDRLQTRLAYNWRDDFFNGVAGASSGTPGPVNVEAYGQWDLSVRYDVRDNMTLFLEGLNLTEETTRTFGRDTRQGIQAAQTGLRVNFGINYTF
ncbi:MAG: TonB-dependent receptor [Gammaproteobacteria bacterium]